MTDYAGILTALAVVATNSGLFAPNPVLTYEARETQAEGLLCAVFLGPEAPVANRSGLATTSELLTVFVRIYGLTQRTPYEDLDPAMYSAAASLRGSYSGAFDLGGLGQLDLLGAHSPGMTTLPGYLTHQDGTRVRILTVNVPIVVDDVFGQAP